MASNEQPERKLSTRLLTNSSRPLPLVIHFTSTLTFQSQIRQVHQTSLIPQFSTRSNLSFLPQPTLATPHSTTVSPVEFTDVDIDMREPGPDSLGTLRPLAVMGYSLQNAFPGHDRIAARGHLFAGLFLSPYMTMVESSLHMFMSFTLAIPQRHGGDMFRIFSPVRKSKTSIASRRIDTFSTTLS